MKALIKIISILMLLVPTTLLAQEEEAKVYKNEFGTLGTGILERFFNFSDIPSLSSTASYSQLTYKRHFKKFSLRLGMSGKIKSGDRLSDNEIDESRIKYKDYQTYQRIGIERGSYISKHWKVYYGVDIRYEHQTMLNEDVIYFANEYREGARITFNRIGFAPLLGFELSIGKRVALQTEASFFVYYWHSRQKWYRDPIVETPTIDPSELGELQNRVTFGYQGEFKPPLFIVLCFKL